MELVYATHALRYADNLAPLVKKTGETQEVENIKFHIVRDVTSRSVLSVSATKRDLLLVFNGTMSGKTSLYIRIREVYDVFMELV